MKNENAGYFITFGFDQSIGDKNLGNCYMIIPKGKKPDDIVKTKDGFLCYAFDYPIRKLERMKSNYSMKEITVEEYLKLKETEK